MFDQPEVAYFEACKICKERFRNNSIISANFEKRLLHFNNLANLTSSDHEQAHRKLESIPLPLSDKATIGQPAQLVQAQLVQKGYEIQKANRKETFPSFQEFVKHINHQAERTIGQFSHTAKPTTDRARCH